MPFNNASHAEAGFEQAQSAFTTIETMASCDEHRPFTWSDTMGRTLDLALWNRNDRLAMTFTELQVPMVLLTGASSYQSWLGLRANHGGGSHRLTITTMRKERGVGTRSFAGLGWSTVQEIKVNRGTYKFSRYT